MRKLIRSASTYVKDVELKCACRNHADFFMEMHKFADCEDEPTIGQFLCSKCFKKWLLKLHGILKQGSGQCPTCETVVVTPSDMIVRIEPVNP